MEGAEGGGVGQNLSSFSWLLILPGHQLRLSLSRYSKITDTAEV